MKMSGGSTTAASAQEPPGFKRAVRKIKCAAMVSNLAKSWQGWANEHAGRQDSIPTGWMPSSVAEGEQREVNLTVTPRVVATDASGGGTIRTCSIAKSVQPKRSECSSGEVLHAIRDKMEAGPDRSLSFQGNQSPTRRRHMRALQSAEGGGGGGGGGGGIIHDRKLMLREKKAESRSSSVDTEDSGLGEEAGLSDNNETKAEQVEAKTASNRPKIKISTMGDIKSRWQQWSNQHLEGQKLNPFSEDFDQDFAMAQRLRKGDTGYGRPKDGSRTAERGERAHRHIHREMEEMVWIIRDMGYKDSEGRTIISFGRLFDRYVKISDKVVGIVLRCRKHGMLRFDGEMLWKGQDDDVIITLTD